RASLRSRRSGAATAHRLVDIGPTGGRSVMHTAAAATHNVTSPDFLGRLNADCHETALRVFMVIVLAHWVEHLLQGLQIYVLGWPVPEARGALGMVFPWLIKSESLHYGYALVMLTGLWMLRSGFTGQTHRFWV